MANQGVISDVETDASATNSEIEDEEEERIYDPELEKPRSMFSRRPFSAYDKYLDKVPDVYPPGTDELLLQEKKEHHIADPSCALAIHFLELRNVSVRVAGYNKGLPMFFYFLVTIGIKKQISSLAMSYTTERVRMDALISRFRDDACNTVKIELWTFQDPLIHYILSTKEMHIYDILYKVHGIEDMRMWNKELLDGYKACDLIYEFSFNYGAFGYGFSNQCWNRERSMMFHLKRCLFPRIAPSPEDTVVLDLNVKLPTKVHIVSLNSFIYEKPNAPVIVNGKKIDPIKFSRPRVFRAHQVEFQNGVPTHCKVNINMSQKEVEAEFNHVYGEYLCIPKREDRLLFMQKLVDGRIDELPEDRIGELYTNMDLGQDEPILEQSLYLRVEKHPCTINDPVVLLPEDEEFLNKFPSLTRTSGWLGRLFGYTPLKTDPHYLEPEVELPQIVVHPDVPWYKQAWSCWPVWCFAAVRHTWAAILFIYESLFPDLELCRPKKPQVRIPEISISLPLENASPFYYGQWVRDEHKIYNERERIVYETMVEDVFGTGEDEKHTEYFDEDYEPDQMDQQDKMQVEAAEHDLAEANHQEELAQDQLRIKHRSK